MKCDKLDEPGCFSYAVFDDEGMLWKVTLQNGASSRDPLFGICNILLKLSDDDRKITGVIVEDDCVLLKSTSEKVEPVANGGNEVNGELDDVSKAGSTMDASPDVSDNLNGEEKHAQNT